MKLTMTGTIRECILLSYRTPADSVRDLLPEGMELVTHGPWAFWSVMACHVERMRPAHLPRWAGVGYDHVAYRLHVRSRLADGRTVEGLYFVRSDANHALVSRFGNWTSDFRFHDADVEVNGDEREIRVNVWNSADGTGNAQLLATVSRVAPLLAGSCFDTPADADGFLRFRPIGIARDPYHRQLRLVEGLRDESRWIETPLTVREAHWGFFDHLGQRDLTLERAVRVAPIDCQWKLGRRYDSCTS